MKIVKVLFEKRYSGERIFIPISDLPTELLIPENNIMIHTDHGRYGSNGWEEGETLVVIKAYREQTDEEKTEFRLHLEELKAKRTEERKKQYLKLKKEFENE